MILELGDCVLDVDIEAEVDYCKNLSLCDCDECRNYYARAKAELPLLTDFLSRMGIDVSAPDEISSFFDPAAGKVEYLMVAYTVVGRIIKNGKRPINIHDNGLFLNISIDTMYVPNEQKTEDHFTVTVCGIRLPWGFD